ncbi:MAG: hypothetical protein JNL39_06145 [Opitutaceae bacterium]|nr:hypothetical protein [Opitutaceae bacterium]
MAATPETLAALRRQLAARFPAALSKPGRALCTGIPALDEAAGGVPLAAVTELACTAPSVGSKLFLAQLLAVARAGCTRVALIDAADSFDPESLPADQLSHLVWVRCPRAADLGSKTTATSIALQAADLLARDANFGLVVLDLRRAPEADLRRIPGPLWYRLQRAVEPTDLALVVLTPRPSVPSAQLRLILDTPAGPGALAADRDPLAARLVPTIQRQRLALDRLEGASAG